MTGHSTSLAVIQEAGSKVPVVMLTAMRVAPFLLGTYHQLACRQLLFLTFLPFAKADGCRWLHADVDGQAHA